MSLIIFDLDGTLVKLPINYDKLRKRLYEEFGDEKVFASLYNFLLSLPNDKRRRAFEIMDEFELESIPNMHIDPTIHECFGIAKNVIKALVTLQGMRPAVKVLKTLGLEDQFSIIVTREYSLDRATQLIHVIEQLRFDKNKVVFIGDTDHDRRASEIVGIKSVILGSTVGGEKVDNILSAVKLALAILSA